MDIEYEYNPEINERIYQIRTKLGLTQAAMANQMGLSIGFFGKIEANTDAPVTKSIAYAICNRYGVSLEYLVHGKGPMFTKDILPLADPRKEEILRIYNELPQPCQELLLDFILMLEVRCNKKDNEEQ